MIALRPSTAPCWIELLDYSITTYNPKLNIVGYLFVKLPKLLVRAIQNAPCSKKIPHDTEHNLKQSKFWNPYINMARLAW